MPDVRFARPRPLLVAIAVGYVAIMLLAPVAMLLAGAFGEGLGAFVRALAQPDVLHALGMTLAMVVGAVALNGVFGVAIAWVLVRDGARGRKILSGLVDVPFAVSPVVAGFVLIELFGSRGWLAAVPNALGVQIVFAWPAMLLATSFVSLPFVVREVAPVLEEIGTEQELAAYTLGAGPWTTFWRITLPSIRWGLAYGVTLTAARAIGEFGAVLVVSGGLAGRTETATTFIYRALEDRNDVGAHAVSLVLALVSMGILVLMEMLKRRRHESAPLETAEPSGASRP